MALLARMDDKHGLHCRGWIFLRQQDGSMTACKAASIVDVEG